MPDRKLSHQKSHMKNAFKFLVNLVLLIGPSLAILEQSAKSVAEYDPYGNPVERQYDGGLESAFSVLQSPTYWTGGCKDNWQRPDDLVFEFTLKGRGGSFTSHNIVYTWENEVMV